MKYKIFILALFAFQSAGPLFAGSDQAAFSVFCTGNHDSTGSCLDVSNSKEFKELDCIMVPGNIIDCKNEKSSNIECILITATSAQAEFSCTHNHDASLGSLETTLIEDTDSQKIDIVDENRVLRNNPTKPSENPFSSPF